MPLVYAQLARGQTVRRVELRKRKDGSTFWTRADGRAVDPQDPLKGSGWSVEDITDERRAEEQLQSVLAEQQALLNNVVVGIHFTRERKTVRCNRRYEEMFGYGPGEAVGASTRDLYFTDAEYEDVGRQYRQIDEHVRYLQIDIEGAKHSGATPTKILEAPSRWPRCCVRREPSESGAIMISA